MKHNRGRLLIMRTEQWEYTAYYQIGKKSILTATGSSKQGAELYLLRKLIFGKDKEPKEII